MRWLLAMGLCALGCAPPLPSPESPPRVAIGERAHAPRVRELPAAEGPARVTLTADAELVPVGGLALGGRALFVALLGGDRVRLLRFDLEQARVAEHVDADAPAGVWRDHLDASGSWRRFSVTDGCVRTWRLELGRIATAVEERGRCIDGWIEDIDAAGRLAVVSRGKKLMIVDLANGSETTLGEVADLGTTPMAFAFDPTGRFVFDSTGRVWDRVEGWERSYVAGTVHDDAFRATSAMVDAARRRVAVTDGTSLFVRDLGTGDAITFDYFAYGYTAWAFVDDDVLLVGAQQNGLWLIRATHSVLLQPSGAPVTHLAAREDIAVAADENGAVTMWNPTTGELRATLAVFTDGHYVVFTQDGHFTGTDGARSRIEAKPTRDLVRDRQEVVERLMGDKT